MKVNTLILSLACFLAAPLAAQEAGTPSTTSAFMQQMVVIGSIVLCFYFILWRPEKKRRKAVETMRTGMKKGDKVIAMGIVGHVSKVNDDTVIVKMCDGAKVEFLKGAITEVHAVQDNGPSEKEDNT